MSEETHRAMDVDAVEWSPVSTVAVLGGPRCREIRTPLEAVDVDVVEDTRDADATIVFSPGWTLARTLGSRLAGRGSGPLVYRLSGEYWTAMFELRAGHERAWLNTRLFGNVDGCLTPDHRLDRIWRARTGNTSTAIARLPIRPEEWPDVRHESSTLRCLSLFSFDSRGKCRPLDEWIPAVEEYLATAGGVWWLAGDGRYADRIARRCSDCAHVEYVGYVDAATWLERANVLLHPSGMDIGAPNAVLEGLASGLPVVVADTRAFQDCPPPVRRASVGDLPAVLSALTDPAARERTGRAGQAFVSWGHDPARIGDHIVTFLTALVRQEQF